MVADNMDDIDEEVEKLVERNTRKELNDMASKDGIKDPESFPRKEVVAREIVKAKRAKKHAKKPTGLYIDPED